MSPRDLTERHVEAFTRRGAGFDPEPDGMAVVWHRTSAVNAAAIFDRATRVAKSLVGVDGETRSYDQVLCDVLDELMLDQGALLPAEDAETGRRQPALHRGVRPQVHVTVPVLTAMGRTEQPADLEGYGPIDAETARRVAGTASGFYRILTEPETGVVLSVGRTQYEVPAALRRYLQVRDGMCRFVGCIGRRSTAMSITPWPGRTVVILRRGIGTPVPRSSPGEARDRLECRAVDRHDRDAGVDFTDRATVPNRTARGAGQGSAHDRMAY